MVVAGTTAVMVGSPMTAATATPVSVDLEPTRLGSGVTTPSQRHRHLCNSPELSRAASPLRPPGRAPCSNIRRRMVCNWAGSMGQPILLSIAQSDMEPIRAPYHVTIRYDLRSIGVNPDGEMPYVAALDVEKLRRKGSGIGLDALQASSSWIARDCLCSRSGRLKAISAWHCPGELKLSLAPATATEQGEAIVMFRVIVLRTYAKDSQDWRCLGAPLVLRMDLGGRLLQQAELEPQFAWAAARVPRPLQEPLDPGRPECWGVRVQQVLDFYGELREDAEMYCAAHRRCTKRGPHFGHHVCIHDPCPYRPINKAKYDDHRGLPFVLASSLTDARGRPDTEWEDLVPSTTLIVERYIRPATRGTGCSMAKTMNQGQPMRCTAFVTHVWSEHFGDFLDTLQSALDPRDVVFLSSFALDQNSSLEPRLQQGALDCSAAASLQALRAADKALVVLDRDLSLLGRLWCSLEIAKAREWRIPTQFWPHRATNLATLEEAAKAWDASALSLADAGDAPPLAAALAASLECFELQPPLRSSWELEDAGGSAAARNERFRGFLGGRLGGLAAALARLAEHRDFSPEQLRQLCAEHERQAALAGLLAEHELRARNANEELEGLRAALRRRDAMHAEENARLRREFEAGLEALRAEGRRQAEEAEAWVTLKDAQCQDLQAQVDDSRATCTNLEEQVQQLQQRLQETESALSSEKERYEKENQLRMDYALQLEQAAGRAAAELAEAQAEREAMLCAGLELEQQLGASRMQVEELTAKLVELEELVANKDDVVHELETKIAVHVTHADTEHTTGSCEPMDMKSGEPSEESHDDKPSMFRSHSTSSGLVQGSSFRAGIGNVAGVATGVASSAAGAVTGAAGAVTGVFTSGFQSGTRLFAFGSKASPRGSQHSEGS